jgi:Outer membrane protein beta-barrel domain
MKVVRMIPLALFVLLVGIQAFAQETPQYEIEAGYSLLHFNPARKYTTSHNLNGGGFAFNYNLNSWLGLKADLEWYGATANAFTFNQPVVAPYATIPVIPAGTYQASGGMFTYQFGPQFKYHGHRVQPWAHTLFGGSKTDVWSNLLKETNYSGYNSKNVSGFAMTIGGGVDILLNHFITLRPMEFSYVLTRLNTPLLTLVGGLNNQNDWRYQAGVVFTLGNHK